MSLVSALRPRRALILTIVAIVVLLVPLVVTACGPAAPKELNLLSWEGYADPEWVQDFEKANNVKVNVTYMGSDDELFAKLRAGQGMTYDAVATNVANLQPLVDSGLIVPLDPAKIPNYDKLLPAFKNKYSVLDNKLYSVPFTWGTINPFYNADEITTPPAGYEDLWDPKYKGKVLLSEDAGINIATAAILLGYDPYNLTDAQMEEVKAKLIDLKHNARAFYTGFQDGANLMISKEAIIGMSQDLSQGKMIRDKGVNVVDYFPKGSLIWVDSWAMTKGGEKKKALVEAWLNHELSVDTQKKHVEKYYRGGVNSDLVPVLDPAIIKGTHMDDMGMFDRLTLMRNPESWEKRLKLWNEVKAAP
jgi:spermidine/putrescine transport system substrate-binding protein